MNFKTIFFALSSCGLVACSGNSAKQIEGSFEYAKKAEAKVISIPQGLKTPVHESEFDIPTEYNKSGPIGEAVDIRAPSLALPIAAASRVEVNSSKAKIWFDQVFDEHDLPMFIHQAVEEQLKVDDVTLAKKNDKAYESGWYKTEIESGFWFFKSIDTTENRRYLIEYDIKPHGRSVSVEVTLIDYVKTDVETANETKDIDIIDKKRAEMAMLNSIVTQVDYQYRLKTKEDRAARATKQIVKIGENEEAEPAYIVDIGIDTLWDAMPLFFRDYGFTVADLNETELIYYVDFEKDTSIFDFMLAVDEDLIQIDDKKYQFVLAEINKKRSSVTLYDDSGVALSAEVLTKIFPQMEKGLSFKTLF